MLRIVSIEEQRAARLEQRRDLIARDFGVPPIFRSMPGGVGYLRTTSIRQTIAPWQEATPLFFLVNIGETNRIDSVVLEFELVILVEVDLRSYKHGPFAIALFIHIQLDNPELVVAGARSVVELHK